MIVTDSQLKTLIEQADNPLLTGYDRPKDWMSKDSLVQPCSIDLHIGSIYQPGIKLGKAGSAGSPKLELVLRTGQTAIVATQESIHLRKNYAGFGFPPSSVSSRALLMTNPGHIDPGYNGELQFTVINMGREEYVLRKKDLIVTVLIFKLDVDTSADYSARHPPAAVAVAGNQIEQSKIDLLSPDFVDVQKRATTIARKTLGYATAGATVLAIILGWAFNAIDKRLEGIDSIHDRLTKVEDANSNLAKQLEATKEQLEKQIDLDHRVAAMELQNRPKVGSK